ncbi:hypothetical protein H4R35_002341 [Dimargaris xerosporica]|nr:hypothetical protein H4R35_002341 [Dimargaris xerosporica]
MAPKTFKTVAEQDRYYKSLAPTFQYSNEPTASRDRDVLLVRAEQPFNAEPKLPQLVEHMVTPVTRFFKRNHGPIPTLEPATYTLTIQVVDGPTTVWRLDQLQTQFGIYEVMAAVQCAGNRRDGLNRVNKVKGVIWGPGTISNAIWSGVKLRDVLVASGVPADPAHPTYQQWHVDLKAYGLSAEDECYGSSIFASKALDPQEDVLLAFKMNGQVLPHDHGYPCRVIVPGVIGARSVKWLRTITVQPHESLSFYQRRDYKVLPPQANATNLALYWDTISALQAMNVQSVICEPTEDTPRPLDNQPYIIKGYAISGGGCRIDRVDVSLDNGKTWLATRLFHPVSSSAARRNPELNDLPTTKHWAWTLWACQVDSGIPKDAVLVCRAWDANGNTQPSEPTWNYRGVMNNSWFKVDTAKCPAAPAAKAHM